MASVTGKSKSEAGKLSSLNIEVMGNGIALRERFVPKPTKGGMCGPWEPDKPSDAMAFTELEECLAYVRKCLAPCFKAESTAEEKAEAKG